MVPVGVRMLMLEKLISEIRDRGDVGFTTLEQAAEGWRGKQSS